MLLRVEHSLVLALLVCSASGCVIQRATLESPTEEDAPVDAFSLTPEDANDDADPPRVEDAGHDAPVLGEDAFREDAFACGRTGDPCCVGDRCEAWLTCAGGTCLSCGTSGIGCCPGTEQCMGTDGCLRGLCDLCGVAGTDCCDGDVCTGAGLTCQSGKCAPIPPPNCDTPGGACCPDGSCGLGLYCGRGMCVSYCGGSEEPCCIASPPCRTGSCRRVGFLDYRCR